MRLLGLILVASTGLMTACTDSVTINQRLTGEAWDLASAGSPPEGSDPFITELHSGYVRLAADELAEYDWEDGAYFLANARLIADGGIPAPIDIADRGLEGETRLVLAATDMAQVRGWPGARLRAPAELGQTQIHFDCWMQEEQEAHQTAQIELCRDDYKASLKSVQELAELPANLAVVLPEDGGAIGGIVLQRDAAEVVLDRPYAAGAADDTLKALPTEEGEIAAVFSDALESQPEAPVSFKVLFPFGSTRPNETEDLDALAAAVVAALEDRTVAEIQVTGYADRVGTPAANRAISRSRARRVARVLEDAVGDRETVRFIVRGRGEADPEEDVLGKSDANRRVIVIVR